MSSPNELAESYLTHARNRTAETNWAFDAALDLAYSEDWESLWTIILAIARRDEQIEVEALAFIAAGPLEALVCGAGPEFIDRIEHEAKFNWQFGRLLTGVWLRGAQPVVRERILKICRAFSDPIDGTYRY